MEEKKLPTMLTIKEMAAKTGFPQTYIRRLCISNKIVYIYTGHRYLINYEKFIDFLNEGDQKVRENVI